MYHLRLFGQLQLIGPSGIVLSGSSRPLQVLLLVTLSRRARSAASLIDILWTDGPYERRQQSFRQALYKLKKAAPDVVRVMPHGVAANRDILTTDLELAVACQSRDDIGGLCALVRGEFLPESPRAGLAFSQWVDSQCAQHWEPIKRRVRQHFKELAKAADWHRLMNDYAALVPPLSDDPVILGAKIRSSIYTVESVTLRREISDDVRTLQRTSRRQADRLTRLLERRIRWDRKVRLHVGPFIGRSSELQAFSAVHKRSSREAGFLCCISGSIGIGKSRTAKQFARIAAIRGSRVEVVQLTLDQPSSNAARVARALRRLSWRSGRVSTVNGRTSKPGSGAAPDVLIIDDIDWGGPACTNLVLSLISAMAETPSLGIVTTAKESSLVQRLLASAPATANVLHLRLQRLDIDERQTELPPIRWTPS